jgi:hypothetical protein
MLVSIIGRFKEVPPPTRLCESMNNPVTSSKAHVFVQLQKGPSHQGWQIFGPMDAKNN